VLNAILSATGDYPELPQLPDRGFFLNLLLDRG